MTAELEPGRVYRVGSLEHAPVRGEQVAEGAPTSGVHAFGEHAGLEVGVWEHTPGVSTDVEADEVFVVLSGRAVIEFVQPSLPAISIGPGDVVRLAEGMETVWHVSETLRKVYLA